MLFSMLLASTTPVEKTYDSFIEDFEKNEGVSGSIRAFDPSQGRSDCEEQALIMMDYLYQKKRYKDLCAKEKRYFVLRDLFSKKNTYDPFGMVVEDRAKKELTDLSDKKQLNLRFEISHFVDKKMKDYTKELLPEDEKDSAFDLLPIGAYNIPRISTTGGIALLFAFAKKHNVPVMLRLKRMEILGDRLKGQGETFFTYRYNPVQKKFAHTQDVRLNQPIFCIRAFSITKGPVIENKKAPEKFQEMFLLFKNLKASKSFKEYTDHLKDMDIEKLMMFLAAREDHNNKRSMSASRFLKDYPPVADLFYDDETYTKIEKGKEIYTNIPKTIAIRHVYVSTLAQQKQSAQKRLKKMDKTHFLDIDIEKNNVFDVNNTNAFLGLKK